MSRERYKQSVLVSTGRAPLRLRANFMLGTLVSPLRGSRFSLCIFPPLPQWATLCRPSGTFLGKRIASMPKLLQAAGAQVR
jgi:hypothetical protein